jgi:RNA polymerase sigma-70 factor (ECF subfamily)
MSQIEALYQEHARTVYRFALGLCGDSHLANDLVSETFVRALTTDGMIEMETAQGYLCTITRRLYLKEWGRRQRHTELEDVHHHPAPGPEQQTMDGQTLRSTLNALQALPETDRTAVLMRANDDVPYEDIARTLGISLSSAKVKVSRARLKLSLLQSRSIP